MEQSKRPQEATITVDGKPYTLRLGLNEACDWEDRFNVSLGPLVEQASRMDFRAIRLLILLLLQPVHGEEFKTVQSVGALIDRGGGLLAFAEAIQAVAGMMGPPPTVN